MLFLVKIFPIPNFQTPKEKSINHNYLVVIDVD